VIPQLIILVALHILLFLVQLLKHFYHSVKFHMLVAGPFTQRVLLTIEEKNLPYALKLVDLANKPDWYASG
jgi:hypothetical protein